MQRLSASEELIIKDLVLKFVLVIYVGTLFGQPQPFNPPS